MAQETPGSGAGRLRCFRDSRSRHWSLVCGAVCLLWSGTAFLVGSRSKAAAEGKSQTTDSHRYKDKASPAKAANTSGKDLFRRRSIPITVWIYVDGTKRKITTDATTVASVLADAKIQASPSDRVYPSLHAAVYNGMRLRVTRVTTEISTTEVPVRYRTVYKHDPALRWGGVKVVNPGKAGVGRQKLRTWKKDGVITAREVIGVETVTAPEDKVVAVGTSRSLTSRGLSSARRVLMMSATAYTGGSESCGSFADGRTALGLRAGYGVVAVDPRLIPLGTRVYVEGYGYAVAGDTGSAIRGSRIDLGFESVQQAMRFGRRRVKVYVLD